LSYYKRHSRKQRKGIQEGLRPTLHYDSSRTSLRLEQYFCWFEKSFKVIRWFELGDSFLFVGKLGELYAACCLRFVRREWGMLLRCAEMY
jgi:hypothetical protein